jgi:hypothetical protein
VRIHKVAGPSISGLGDGPGEGVTVHGVFQGVAQARQQLVAADFVTEGEPAGPAQFLLPVGLAAMAARLRDSARAPAPMTVAPGR